MYMMYKTYPQRLAVNAAVLLCSAWLAAVTTEGSNTEALPLAPSAVAAAAAAGDGAADPPSTLSPFARWDEASAEQEAESEDGHRVTERSGGPSSVLSPSSAPSSSSSTFLLVLLGNATVARLRRRDFAKYVRVNLAARLSLEYDDVAIAGVAMTPPTLVVNVTLDPSGNGGSQKALPPAAALMRMAQTNATLLELSGEEYRVSRVITPTSMLTPKVSTEGSTAALRHEEVEKGVFTAAGAAVALMLLAAALGAMARLRRCGSPKPSESPLPPPPPPPPIRPRRRPLAPPKVIYTGAFALTLGAGRGTVRMGPGGCAVHSRMPTCTTGPVGGPGVGRRALGAAEGAWKGKSWDDRGRRMSQRHLSTSVANDCSFDNPNFEK